MWHGAADGDCGLVAIHIASITPQRSKPQPSLRKRAWRFILNMLAMAMMCLGLLAAISVLAMRFAFRCRVWRFLIEVAAVAMVVGVIPAAVVLAMRAALAVAR